MIEKINVLMDTNEKLVLDMVSAFKIKQNNEDRVFAIITNNELDQNGLVKLLVSEVKNDTLVKIEDENLWGVVKNAMRAIISSGTFDFTYELIPSDVKSSGEVFRIIAVQEAAKTQLISDYVAKRPAVGGGDGIPKEETLIDNPAIYPTENPEVKVTDEVSSGISYEEPKKEEEVSKPVNVLESVPKEVQEEPAVSMDDLVKEALKTTEEPTNFNVTNKIDNTTLMVELESYIRNIVRDEISKQK